MEKAVNVVTELDRCLCESASWHGRINADTIVLTAIQWFKKGLFRKSGTKKLCWGIVLPYRPQAYLEKTAIPKDNLGTESLPLEKDMTHTLFNKITIHPFITSVAPLRQNISLPQSQLA